MSATIASELAATGPAREFVMSFYAFIAVQPALRAATVHVSPCDSITSPAQVLFDAGCSLFVIIAVLSLAHHAWIAYGRESKAAMHSKTFRGRVN